MRRNLGEGRQDELLSSMCTRMRKREAIRRKSNGSKGDQIKVEGTRRVQASNLGTSGLLFPSLKPAEQGFGGGSGGEHQDHHRIDEWGRARRAIDGRRRPQRRREAVGELASQAEARLPHLLTGIVKVCPEGHHDEFANRRRRRGRRNSRQSRRGNRERLLGDDLCLGNGSGRFGIRPAALG